MEEVKAIEVVDIEKDLVKELLLTKLTTIQHRINLLNQNIKLYESKQKENKEKVKNLYANVNSSGKGIDSQKSRLYRVAHIYKMREGIADLQGKIYNNRQILSRDYKNKAELKKELAKYNLIADVYKIMLYK